MGTQRAARASFKDSPNCLYGVLAYLAAQRTVEFGIRLALGAQRKALLSLLLFEGLKPALLGLLIGLPASAALVRLIQSMLYETQPLDPLVFGSVAGLLLFVAIAACLAPALGAARLDLMKHLEPNSNICAANRDLSVVAKSPTHSSTVN